MKKSMLLLCLLVSNVCVFGQVNLNSSTGRVKDINTDFSFRLTDKQYDRIMLQSGWSSGIGDYLSIKHGGGNVEQYTYGLRISDAQGFDFGRNDFSTSFLKIKTNGYIGIGTTNPIEKLHLQGNFAIGDGGVGIPFKMWAGSNGSTNHFRLGTDIGHYGDAALEVYQNYSGGSEQNPGKVIVNGNLGIGTTNPTQKFEVYNTNAFNTSMENQNQDHISLISNDPGNGGFFGGITWKSSGRRRAAIAATREHTDSDHVGLAFFTKGTDGPGPIYESMRVTRYGNVGIGTTAPDAKLTVKGDIHAEEVKIDLSVPAPDYVFTKDYDLLTIEEVQQHIAAQGHLPNIPSATEMEVNGVELGLMNMKLLEKIEELTLYTIAQEKEINQLRSENKKQKTINDQQITNNQNLEARLAKIEELLGEE